MLLGPHQEPGATEQACCRKELTLEGDGVKARIHQQVHHSSDGYSARPVLAQN
jgi:hypothetical protein